MQALYLLSLCLLPCALAQVDLNSYPLQAELRPGVYTLYWSFDVEQETIRFAVRVATTGWVGFGLSPNGGMANSDVVIGWVNGEGAGFFNDRYATGESRPDIDSSQDWVFEGGLEENGNTTLAFSRKWVTCDDRDREIRVETARLIFSWGDNDPLADDPENVDYHGMANRGAFSLNLLGATLNPGEDPADLEELDIIVDNITIPTDTTTYWCSAFAIPSDIIQDRRFVTKYTPVISPGNEAYVHHILIYECDTLNEAHVGESGVCDGEVSDTVSECRGGVLLAGWAVGGTEFVYPENVAYPIGGAGAPRYLVMETHYDNPDMDSGVKDSSGMSFSHTAQQPLNEAGVLQVGYTVSRHHVIPPGASTFNTFGDCASGCTSSYFPEEGITVFSNLLHTHLAGVGVTLHHLRRLSPADGDTCSALEEITPIEENRQYDFNYQQYTTLPKPIQVLPGDILRLECNYDTTDRDGVILGGPATRDEMCLSFLNYYPRNTLSTCITAPYALDSATLHPNFLQEFRDSGHLTTETYNALKSAQSRSASEAAWAMVNWTSDAIAVFEEDITNGPVIDLCIPADAQSFLDFDIYPKDGSSTLPDCEYQAPDQCTGFQPMDCCTRLGGGAVKFTSSVLLIALCLILLQALM